MNFNTYYYLVELSQAAINKAIQKFVKDGNDEDEVTQLVNSFNDLTKKNKIKKVDIFTLSFDELKNVVSSAQLKKSRSEKEKIIKDNETEFVFENDKVLVVSPKTHASSCKYGKGTQWCTTQRYPEAWNEYYRQGDKLYYILPKKGDGKIAVVVSMNGSQKIFNEEDLEMSSGDLKKLTKEYKIPKDIFQPLDKKIAGKRRSLTDEEIKMEASSFLEYYKIVSEKSEYYEKAMNAVISLINRYNLKASEDENVDDVVVNVEKQLDNFASNLVTTMNVVKLTYDVDTRKEKNWFLLLTYMTSDKSKNIEDLKKIDWIKK